MSVKAADYLSSWFAGVGRLTACGLVSVLPVGKVIRAFVHAAIAGVIAFVMSGGNLGVALARFRLGLPDATGMAIAGLLAQPQWNSAYISCIGRNLEPDISGDDSRFTVSAADWHGDETSDRLTAHGTDVRYIGTTFVPAAAHWHVCLSGES